MKHFLFRRLLHLLGYYRTATMAELGTKANDKRSLCWFVGGRLNGECIRLLDNCNKTENYVRVAGTDEFIEL